MLTVLSCQLRDLIVDPYCPRELDQYTQPNQNQAYSCERQSVELGIRMHEKGRSKLGVC